MPQTSAAEKTIKEIRRATRKRQSAEDKSRIVPEGLRGEYSIAVIRRRDGPNAGDGILSQINFP